jgi:hypothetical protein
MDPYPYPTILTRLVDTKSTLEHTTPILRPSNKMNPNFENPGTLLDPSLYGG